MNLYIKQLSASLYQVLVIPKLVVDFVVDGEACQQCVCQACEDS